MGQYYRPVLIYDNKVVHIFNGIIDGQYTPAKLTEHSWVGNSLMNAICEILHAEPCRVFWVGDYADEEEFARLKPEKVDLTVERIWEVDGEGLSKVDFDVTDKFICNRDKCEYINMARYCNHNNIDGWILHPLSLLTTIGNGRGGGDYRGKNIEDIGRWAGDEILIVDNVPLGMIEYRPEFEDK